jgi:hypothetical protein
MWDVTVGSQSLDHQCLLMDHQVQALKTIITNPTRVVDLPEMSSVSTTLMDHQSTDLEEMWLASITPTDHLIMDLMLAVDPLEASSASTTLITTTIRNLTQAVDLLEMSSASITLTDHQTTRNHTRAADLLEMSSASITHTDHQTIKIIRNLTAIMNPTHQALIQAALRQSVDLTPLSWIIPAVDLQEAVSISMTLMVHQTILAEVPQEAFQTSTSLTDHHVMDQETADWTLKSFLISLTDHPTIVHHRQFIFLWKSTVARRDKLLADLMNLMVFHLQCPMDHIPRATHLRTLLIRQFHRLVKPMVLQSQLDMQLTAHLNQILNPRFLSEHQRSTMVPLLASVHQNHLMVHHPAEVFTQKVMDMQRATIHRMEKATIQDMATMQTSRQSKLLCTINNYLKSTLVLNSTMPLVW